MNVEDYKKGYREGFKDAFDIFNNKSDISIDNDIKYDSIADTDLECPECGMVWSITDKTPKCINITCPFN
jgi:hypothetical protein